MIKIFKELKNQQVNLDYFEILIIDGIKGMSYEINHVNDIICWIRIWIFVYIAPFFIILHPYHWLIIIICIVLYFKFINKYIIISSLTLIDTIYIHNLLIYSF